MISFPGSSHMASLKWKYDKYPDKTTRVYNFNLCERRKGKTKASRHSLMHC